MHVERALRRALDEAAHLTLHALVALGLDERNVEELGGRMEARGHDRRAGREHRPAALEHLGDRVANRPRRQRAHLDLGPERLVVDPLPRELDGAEHALGDVGERERVAVHEQHLLLEPDRERLALAEAVLGRRPLVAHGRSPSAARAATRPKTSAAASPLA